WKADVARRVPAGEIVGRAGVVHGLNCTSRRLYELAAERGAAGLLPRAHKRADSTASRGDSCNGPLACELPVRQTMSFVWSGGVEMLSGDLVSVREVVDADAPTLYEMLADPRVAEHMSPPPPSVSAFRGFVEWARRQRAAGEGICFGIVPHGLDSAVGI